MADPYLTTFLCDVRSVLYGVFAGIEFLVGMGYYGGKQLASAGVTVALFIWQVLCEASIWAGFFIEEIIELENFVIRCLLLVYFALCQIVEAFYITFQDLASLVHHVGDTTKNFCTESSIAVISSIKAVTIVPSQLVSALNIVGDFALSGMHTVCLVVKDFVTQLILAPLQVIMFFGNCIYTVLALPGQIFKDITFSAFLGICVLVALYYVFHRRVIYAPFRISWVLLKWIYSAFCNMSSQLHSLIFRQRSKYDDDRTDTLNSPSGKITKGICVVCQEHPVVFIAQPCKHVCLCFECVRTLVDFDSRCPMCRRPVQQYERVYIS